MHGREVKIGPFRAKQNCRFSVVLILIEIFKICSKAPKTIVKKNINVSLSIDETYADISPVRLDVNKSGLCFYNARL